MRSLWIICKFIGCMRSLYSNKFIDFEKSLLGILKFIGYKVYRFIGRMKSLWI